MKLLLKVIGGVVVLIVVLSIAFGSGGDKKNNASTQASSTTVAATASTPAETTTPAETAAATAPAKSTPAATTPKVSAAAVRLAKLQKQITEITGRMTQRMDRIQELSATGQKQSQDGDVAGICATVTSMQYQVTANHRDLEKIEALDLPTDAMEKARTKVVSSVERTEESFAVAKQAAKAYCD